MFHIGVWVGALALGVAGCASSAPGPAASGDTRVDSAQDRRAATPDGEASAPARGSGWWCSQIRTADGTLTSSCSRTHDGCIATDEKMSTAGGTTTDCVQRLLAYCFDAQCTATRDNCDAARTAAHGSGACASVE
jgi:hypothetical protein